MNALQRVGGLIALLTVCSFLAIVLYTRKNEYTAYKELGVNHQDIYGSLNEEVDRLTKLLAAERQKLERVRIEVEEYVKLRNNAATRRDTTWSKPIGVLVFVCNRADAIRVHLEKLIKYRKNPTAFPIIVSQDCDNDAVANVVTSFGDQVQYIKHVSGEKANITIPANQHQYTSYFRIARHYKLGLDHVFNKLGVDSVIITEDDLDIAPDFFDYFAGTRWLLDADASLFCVSAWNDNGKAAVIDTTAATKLYRSDFFPGLGWMFTKSFWDELAPKWPKGFWDDWLRDPAQRKGRSCIRPEISRTAMTQFGQKGASQGLFFNQYLKKIMLNTDPVNFTNLDLQSLTKSNYDTAFVDVVYGLPNVTINDAIAKTLKSEERGSTYRIEYGNMTQYTEVARKLKIMFDTKAGVPRTAYKGIVTAFINGVRLYAAPTLPWMGYDVTWEPPTVIEADS
uniref:Alpha-1,3-mannosyl-glycoprotein 2-beta-N-acetylglucosaminyltransferase n=1 Tax=Panagrellus redivivus TaxID=6233 RepID=A0A7E4VHZ8_PANRE